MYIRRKVFSVAIDSATGEEKLFSVNEVMNAETYQKTFAKKEEEEEKPKKSHRGAKIAVGAAGATGLAAGGIKLADVAGKRMVDSAKKKIADTAKKAGIREITADEAKLLHDRGMKRKDIGEKLQKPAEKVREASKGIVNAGKKAVEFVGKHPKAAKGTAIGLTATGLAAGGAYGAKKYHDKKKAADKK